MVDFAARFWSRVDMSGGPDACWPWMGARWRERGGYGAVRYKDRILRCNRVAIVLGFGKVKPRKLRDGDYALHSCDNPPCCNPAHLRVDTQSQNVREEWQRTRRHCEPTQLTLA
jgi:hypothetical protein